MKNLNDLVKDITTWGTPACAVFCALIGALIAILVLVIGFWKTLLVVALAAVGAFVGGVKDKREFVRDFFNRKYPPQE